MLPSSGGVTGTLNLDLYAYGNLGQSKVYSSVRGITTNKPITAQSDGLDEDTALQLVRTAFAHEEKEARDRKALIDEYGAAVELIGGVITLGAIVLYVAGVISFALAALIGSLVALATLVILVVVSIVAWIFGPHNPPLMQSIIDRFPRKV
ncbi:MAG: hypothetical protein H0W83_00295 [Planctomycetes bacterium]|nr:hypothetical protein [Planctomycetota bacterium]